jgi:hypothetical protein
MILSILSDFLWPEKLTHKKFEQFWKTSILDDKTYIYTKNAILALGNLAKLVFYYHKRMEVLQNCSAFFVCQFLWQEKI